MGVYPRFFLFALPVGFLLAVRGLRLIVEWVIAQLKIKPGPIKKYGWVGLGLAGALLTTVALSPLYRIPKQDFSGALAYAEQVKQPDDQVVGVNMAGNVYDSFYRPNLPMAEDVTDLQALRQQGHTLWLIYIFPKDMEARFPALYQLITKESQPVRKFPGLIGDGEVYLSKMNP